MAQNDNATLVINTGHFYTAVVGTVLPTDLAAPPVAWTSIGHTSLTDIFSLTSEGGEATVLGTLQNKSLRTSYSNRTETFSVTLQQFDTAALKLYYGSNATVNVDGTIGIPQTPVPTSTAFLAVFADGANKFAIYVPKSEILRGDDLALADTESLAGLPLAITPLAYMTNAFTYAITPLGVA